MDEVNETVKLTVHKGVGSRNRARNRGADAGGVAGNLKINLAQVVGRSAGEQARNNSGQEHHGKVIESRTRII